MSTTRGSRAARSVQPAPELPVAQVLVDSPLPHLDRVFDYLVSADQHQQATPGVRVRVRFSGRLLDGFLTRRVAISEHRGRLAYLQRVVSPEPVLRPEIAALCRAVADRYAGTVSDVLRLAVPPRHARVESEAPAGGDSGRPAGGDSGRPAGGDSGRPAGGDTAWQHYPRGPAFLRALREGRQAPAVWQAEPGEDWPARLAEAAAAALHGGRDALLVMPDQRDCDRLQRACHELLGPDAVVTLAAGLGPARRYRRWLSVLRARRPLVVLGTRAAAFAPLRDPGLLAVWDDGDDSHAEPRAPYPHVREILGLRAQGVPGQQRPGGDEAAAPASGAERRPSLLLAGFARTVEAHQLVDSGWAHEIVTSRQRVREVAPRVTALADRDEQLARDPAARAARLPSVAFEAARTALHAKAPVLVQVPRRGYLPTLACGNCRGPARCRRCAGPLGMPQHAAGEPGLPCCRWCGAVESGFRCPECGSARLRAVTVGSARTAEELGRAFPGTTVRTSGGGEVLDRVSGAPELVVATPGAEPAAPHGYGAALLLDGAAMLAREDLRAAEETLRRWLAAAAMVRSRQSGGRVVVVAESEVPTVQALVRWDPRWHAEREYGERAELGFPPVTRMAAVDGSATAVQQLLDAAQLPQQAEVLGPVPVETPRAAPAETAEPSESAEPVERVLLRVPREHGRALTAALAAAKGVRSARKDARPARVQVDPPQLL